MHVLITGASSGLGAALAARYARDGAKLSLCGRNRERLESVAASLRDQAADVSIDCLDVCDPAALEGWIAARDREAPLDLVVANAGISGGTALGVESEDQIRAIFETNVMAAIQTVQAALRLMESRGRGQIAVISSLAGFRGMPGAPAYCASKAALRVYAESLRADYTAKGIKINTVCPGFVQTPMTDVNGFKMPFLMTAEKAADIIHAGLARDMARIAFPWPMVALVHLLSALPQDWVNAALARLPRKP